MFESDKPSKLNNIWWLLSVAAGLGLGHNFPPTWDVKGASYVLYIASPLLLVKAILTQTIYELKQADISPSTLTAQKTKYTNLSPQNGYALEVQAVKPAPNMEKRFAQVLLAMRSLQPNDEGVDLREEFWIKKGVRDKFQNRDEYKATRDKWEAASILAKRFQRTNSPYYVMDWEKVKRIAGGDRLL